MLCFMPLFKQVALPYQHGDVEGYGACDFLVGFVWRWIVHVK